MRHIGFVVDNDDDDNDETTDDYGFKNFLKSTMFYSVDSAQWPQSPCAIRRRRGSFSV